MARKKFTKQQLAKYQKLLLEKKARILGDVEQLKSETLGNSPRDASGDLSAYALHPADLGSDAAEQDVLLQLAESDQKAIVRINHALDRIENGSYGQCELCTKMVETKRLEAMPEATICMDCMKKYDL